ncbi:MAG: thioredoxin fold domain-containing protein [Burkholderiales bacterium]|nr:thioredoxin fold domain-containing protein [Burkholderiales bacterium]
MSRRSIRSLLTIALVLALAACKDSPAPATPATPAKSSAPASPAAPAAAPAAGGNLLEQAARGNGFTVGSMMAAKTIYVFFDPQCPHCGHLWEAAMPLANQLRMVWIPVAFIGAKSAPQGAALLAAQDPMTAMTAHEKSLLAKQGGLIPPDNLPAELAAKVKANTELWKQLGGESVPFTIFKKPGSEEVGKFAGALDTENLKRLLGL